MLSLSERPKARDAIRALRASESGGLFLTEFLAFLADARKAEHDTSDYLEGEPAIVSRGVSRCLGEMERDLRKELKR